MRATRLWDISHTRQYRIVVDQRLRTQLLPYVVLIAALLFSACVEKSSLATQTPPFSPAPTESTSQVIPSAEAPTEAIAPPQPPLAGDTLAQPRELFRQGYRAYLAKKYAEAQALLQRALDTYPILADYSLYYLGALNQEEGQPAEARLFFQRLLAEQGESIWADHARLALAQFALVEQDWATATLYAEQLRTAKSATVFVRQAAMLVLAQAREGLGDTRDAYDLYQELRRITPQSTTGKTAKARVDQLRLTDPTQFGLQDEQDYLEEIRLLQKEGEDVNLDDLAHQFNTRFPTSTLRSEVLMLLAGVYKRQGRVTEAATTWQEVVEHYPGSALAPVALFDWATLLWNKDRDDEALTLFARLTQQYPHHEKAAEAWYASGRIWQERKDEPRATAAYDRLATLFTGSQLAREARWRQGWMAYQRGDFQRAGQVFASLAQSAAGAAEGESAAYWQARAHERLGETAKAVQQYQALLRRYPDGYYAMLVEKRLALAPAPLKPGVERTSFPPSLPPRLDLHYRRSQELVALGLPFLARRELDAVKDGLPRDYANSLFLLTEYSRMEGYAAALRFAQALVQETGGSWLRYLYPQAYWQTIRLQAQTKQLDPYLVLALIRQESLFNPEAVSPAHAYGLMQLLPKTAARVTKATTVLLSSLLEPEFNISAGTAYLRQLLDLYNGNAPLAIAAYNAGENAVDKWRTRYTNLEPDEFVENISFRETRNYVKLVLRNYRTYRRLYGEAAGM